MIGNDVIDLNVAKIQSRWREQRFLDKIFTEAEQKMVVETNNRFHTIWLLWSMKESAFKIFARSHKMSIFNPKDFHCKITSETFGAVSFNHETVQTTTTFNSDVIYTTAQYPYAIQLNDYVFLEGISQFEKSEKLKKKTIEAFAELKDVSKGIVAIEKDIFGIPYFLINNEKQHAALSLTHHGQYGGYAISF